MASLGRAELVTVMLKGVNHMSIQQVRKASLPALSIVVATNNPGKVREFNQLLRDLPVEWLSIAELAGADWSVAETGATFEENAVIKAQAACRATGFVALADDSGLEVDALLGKPGVFSARFAHGHATDAENNVELLRLMQYVPDTERAARFRCVLALATPYISVPVLTHGACTGHIGRTPEGMHGFGYDPLFLVDGMGGRSMAELTAEEKGKISHRGQAVERMRPMLNELLRRMT